MAMVSRATRSYQVPWDGAELALDLPIESVQTDITFTDFPALADPGAALIRAMDEPIGTRPLAELVWPGAKVALLTGDRMTNLMLGSRDGLGHVILDYLNRAGVRDEDVTLVFACGTHPHGAADEKIGAKLIDRVGRYVKHRSGDDAEVSFVGYTSYGNAVWLNRAVVEADIVIGFGEISPNTHGGWCGGGKMILPGVAGRATVENNHRHLIRPDTPLGLADSNPLRRDMKEGADLGRLAFKIDVLVNSEKQIVAMYSGDFRQEHRAALAQARQIWMTKMEPVDIAIYAPGDGRDRYLEHSLFITLDSAFLATKPAGVIILMASSTGGYCPTGAGFDYSERMTSRELLKLSSPDIAREMIFSTGNIRTSSMLFAAKRVLEQRTVLLVSEGMEASEARELGFADGFHSCDDALDHASSVRGTGATMATCFPRFIQWRIMPWREG